MNNKNITEKTTQEIKGILTSINNEIKNLLIMTNKDFLYLFGFIGVTRKDEIKNLNNEYKTLIRVLKSRSEI